MGYRVAFQTSFVSLIPQGRLREMDIISHVCDSQRCIRIESRTEGGKRVVEGFMNGRRVSTGRSP